ncbi:MAG: 2-C-methyl-D-erythritol 4-phosphate cytidylyltransferase [Parasporobacterium sp.]|nr:2-C-methyl-D-erythritol 4-phosphate cytidylyltransferase [Parasporobacterium sp.]
MISAMLFAGGTGTRMHSGNIPKQFIEVDGVPIIIRTLQKFDEHPQVDEIVISCISSGIEKLNDLIRKYGIKKVRSVVPGGATGYESIHNGLVEVAKAAKDSDIILICDGVRPVISSELISECIDRTRKYGMAVPVVKSIDSVLISTDGKFCDQNMPRENIYITQAPQGYTLQKILWAHSEAEKRGIENPTSSADLMIALGEKIHIFLGERDNIKVTTPEDLYTLRSHYYYEHYRKFAREELLYE